MKDFKPLLFIVFFAFFFISCDTVGTEKNSEDNPVVYTAVDGLEQRTTSFSQSSSSAAAKTTTPSFEIVGHVSAPEVDGNSTRASDLEVFVDQNGDDLLYVGYKTLGDEYGGGVDILNVESGFSPATGTGANSLQVNGMDVQELSLKKDSEALFVSVGDKPESLGGPSRFHSVNVNAQDGLPTNNLKYEEVEIRGVIGKGVVGMDNGNALAVSDEDAAYQFDISGSNYEIEGITEYIEPGADFRSVVSFNNEGYVLSDAGNVREVGSSGLSSPIDSLSTPVSEDGSIARMGAQKIGGQKLLFVPLNDNGFRVMTTNGKVTFSETELFATSITASNDYVYVSTGDGLAVYGVEDGIDDETDDGLKDLGRASISELPNSSGVSFTEAQVNYIYIEENGTPNDPDDDALYVAKSDDGVLKIDQDTGGGVWN